MDYALNSIIGKRDNQEDYGVIKSTGSSGQLLAVIADGMGGQVAGEVASSGVVNEFVESFFSNNSKNLPLKLNIALDKANRAIAKSVSADPRLKGMGATLIAAQIDDTGVSWISVGDSVLYLYRDKKIQRLNDDHSMMPVLQDSVRRGRISYDEARVHPHRNALRSAVTGEEISIVDLREEPLPLKSGDVLVLATDGILTLSEVDIGIVLEKNKTKSASIIVDQLLDAVVKINKPRQDNTLIELVKISSIDRSFLKLSSLIAVICALIFMSGLTYLTINKELFTSHWFATDAKTELPDSKKLDQKITPILVEESISTDKKSPSSVTSGQIPVSVSTPSVDVESPVRISKSIPEKKMATGSKGQSKSEGAIRAGTLNGGSQQSKIDKPLLNETNVVAPPIKLDSLPKSDNEQANKLVDVEKPNMSNTD